MWKPVLLARIRVWIDECATRQMTDFFSTLLSKAVARPLVQTQSPFMAVRKLERKKPLSPSVKTMRTMGISILIPIRQHSDHMIRKCPTHFSELHGLPLGV